MDRNSRNASVGWERELCKNPAYVKQLLKSLSDRAANGDKFAATQVAKILTDHPELRDTVQEICDLTTKVEIAWVKALAGADQLTTEAVQKEIAAMRADLICPHSGLLDRTLGAVVVVSVMAYQRAAGLAAQPAPNPMVAAHRDRQLESAQRRLANAIKNWQLHTQKAGQGLTLPAGVRLFDPTPARRRRQRKGGVVGEAVLDRQRTRTS